MWIPFLHVTPTEFSRNSPEQVPSHTSPSLDRLRDRPNKLYNSFSDIQIYSNKIPRTLFIKQYF